MIKEITDFRCVLCGSDSLAKLEYVDVAEQHKLYSPSDTSVQSELTAAAAESALAYQMYRCNSCGIEFALPATAPNASWYNLAYQSLNLYPQSRWEFNFVINKFPLHGTVLELGCGSGEFLKICRNKNIIASGFDFSPVAVKASVDEGLDVKLFDLSDELPVQTIVVNNITAFHILEHLENPYSLFSFAAKFADRKTNLWVAIPSDLRPSRLFHEKDFLDQPPHHMTRWSKSALDQIAIKSNWVLKEVFYEPISLNASCWWITTRLNAYKWFSSASTRNSFALKILRLLLFPFAFIMRFTLYKQIKGFTQLARFQLK